MTAEIRRRVVCAAIRDKKTGAIILGVRHFDRLMHKAIDAQGGDWKGAEQGFVDNQGEFISREEAWQLAAIRGQVLRLVGNQKSITEDGHDLYSENLY